MTLQMSLTEHQGHIVHILACALGEKECQRVETTQEAELDTIRTAPFADTSSQFLQTCVRGHRQTRSKQAHTHALKPVKQRWKIWLMAAGGKYQLPAAQRCQSNHLKVTSPPPLHLQMMQRPRSSVP